MMRGIALGKAYILNEVVTRNHVVALKDGAERIQFAVLIDEID